VDDGADESLVGVDQFLHRHLRDALLLNQYGAKIV
jgi:hypothetical protein